MNPHIESDPLPFLLSIEIFSILAPPFWPHRHTVLNRWNQRSQRVPTSSQRQPKTDWLNLSFPSGDVERDFDRMAVIHCLCQYLESGECSKIITKEEWNVPHNILLDAGALHRSAELVYRRRWRGKSRIASLLNHALKFGCFCSNVQRTQKETGSSQQS